MAQDGVKQSEWMAQIRAEMALKKQKSLNARLQRKESIKQQEAWQASRPVVTFAEDQAWPTITNTKLQPPEAESGSRSQITDTDVTHETLAENIDVVSGSEESPADEAREAKRKAEEQAKEDRRRIDAAKKQAEEEAAKQAETRRLLAEDEARYAAQRKAKGASVQASEAPGTPKRSESQELVDLNVPKEVLDQYMDLFDFFDSDNNNYLDASEFRNMMTRLFSKDGNKPTAQSLEAVFAQVDVNNDQKISRPEFVQFMENMRTLHRQSVSNKGAPPAAGNDLQLPAAAGKLSGAAHQGSDMGKDSGQLSPSMQRWYEDRRQSEVDAVNVAQSANHEKLNVMDTLINMIPTPRSGDISVGTSSISGGTASIAGAKMEKSEDELSSDTSWGDGSLKDLGLETTRAVAVCGDLTVVLRRDAATPAAVDNVCVALAAASGSELPQVEILKADVNQDGEGFIQNLSFRIGSLRNMKMTWGDGKRVAKRIKESVRSGRLAVALKYAGTDAMGVSVSTLSLYGVAEQPQPRKQARPTKRRFTSLFRQKATSPQSNSLVTFNHDEEQRNKAQKKLKTVSYRLKTSFDATFTR